MSHRNTEWLESFARFGYLAKGAVYFLVSILAATAALKGGNPEGSQGAFDMILRQPFGRFLLGIVGVGLLGYASWRMAQSFLDAESKGDDLSGLAQRGGYLLSGLVHTGLAFAAINSACSSGAASTQSSSGATATLLAQPFGRWLVGLIGLGLVGFGLFRLYTAWSKSFKSNLRLQEMSAKEKTLATRAGQFGIAARSVVFAITGYLFLQAAATAHAKEAGSTQDVLMVLEQQGAGYLGVMAFGLMAYAVYQMFLARYRHINPNPTQ